MRSKILMLVVVLNSTFILLISCQKKLDVPKDELAGTPLPTTETYCRIASIWEHPNTPEQKFYNFIYDEYENPVAITGIPYRTFEYDSWHRLKKYVSDYGNGIFGLHHYGYDNQGRIGVDTFYIRATTSDHPKNYESRRIITYTYDSENRIVEAFVDFENTPFDWLLSYGYDSNGNQLYPGFCCSVYDDKINVNRTNDVWMFINLDYGKNNRFVASEYNEFGYPTNVKMRGLGNLFADLIDLMDCRISYSCRPSNYY
jgi:hypothetical protein